MRVVAGQAELPSSTQSIQSLALLRLGHILTLGRTGYTHVVVPVGIGEALRETLSRSDHFLPISWFTIRPWTLHRSGDGSFHRFEDL